jgi:Arm domain-containing DNA-binding protein
MAINTLTDANIRGTKPGDRLVKLSDGGGLQLWVMPNGAKYWRLAYRLGCKQKLASLGVYLQSSLAEARKARDAGRQLVKTGLDPVQEKRSQRVAHAVSQANTWGAVAAELLAKNRREGRAKRTLEKNGVAGSPRHADPGRATDQ